MSVQTIADIVIGLALVGFLMYRQATWQFLDAGRIWRLPVILGGIGVVTLAKSSSGPVTSTDIAFIGAEIVVTVALGALMGGIAQFRVAARPDDKGRSVQTRTGGLGAVLWLVLIVVRVGMDLIGAQLGAHLLASTGMILLMLGVNRAARAFVLDRRIPAHVRAGA